MSPLLYLDKQNLYLNIIKETHFKKKSLSLILK